MKAQDLLNILQSQITSTPDKEQMKVFEEKYANNKAEIFEKASTMLENYGELLAAPVIQVMTDYERGRLGNTIVAAVPLSSINARTYKADNNEYLIAVNDRLLALIYSWSELQIMPFVAPDSWSDNFARIFAPVIDCYLTPNSGCALPIISFEEIPEEYSPVLVLKTQCAEQFIVAHELAHIVLGHLEKAGDLTIHENSYSFSTESYNIEQQKEYDADVQAVQWMKKSFEAQGMPNKFMFFCVEVFVLFHYIECNLGFPLKTGSHPSALSRLINIQKHFPDIDGIADMVENCKDINSFKIVCD